MSRSRKAPKWLASALTAFLLLLQIIPLGSVRGEIEQNDLIPTSVEYSRGFFAPSNDSKYGGAFLRIYFEDSLWRNGSGYRHRERWLSFWFEIPAPNGSGELKGPSVGLNFYTEDASCDKVIEVFNGTVCEDFARVSTQLLYSLVVEEVVEFKDIDNNGAYDSRIDEAVSSVEANELSHSLPSVVGLGTDLEDLQLPFSDEGQSERGNISREDAIWSEIVGFKITVAGEGSFNLSLKCYIFLEPFVLNGLALSPTDLKMSFLVDGFSFQSNDTRLALVTELGSATLIHMTPDEHNLLGVGGESKTAIAFFKWSQVAEIDGEIRAVHSASFPSPSYPPYDYVWLSLSYARGSTIIHDPVLGVREKDVVLVVVADGDLIDASAAMAFALSFVVTLVTLAAIETKGASKASRQGRSKVK